MCTRANHGSVPDSLHAVFVSLLAIASALTVLVFALVTAPVPEKESLTCAYCKPIRPNAENFAVMGRMPTASRFRPLNLSLPTSGRIAGAVMTSLPRGKCATVPPKLSCCGLLDLSEPGPLPGCYSDVLCWAWKDLCRRDRGKLPLHMVRHFT